ncbi:MAG: hypothetical protein AABY54_07735 [Deltaproteobacteria bacterium]
MILAAIYFAGSSPTLADTLIPNLNIESSELREKSVGQRIAHWAEAFVGTPYDTDPLGKYVREERIVADDAVDCMYLTFRTVELALSMAPEDAVKNALNLRFRSKGRLDGERVLNYDDRFEYGEDMIDSGKWGKEMTSDLGRTVRIKGSRGRNEVVIIPKDELAMITNLDVGGMSTPFRDGDIIFFIKEPSKRVVGEIVGHIGIISVRAGVPYLIHASGQKDSADSKGNGTVKSVRLFEYVGNMRFAGIRVTRFQ